MLNTSELLNPRSPPKYQMRQFSSRKNRPSKKAQKLEKKKYKSQTMFQKFERTLSTNELRNSGKESGRQQNDSSFQAGRSSYVDGKQDHTLIQIQKLQELIAEHGLISSHRIHGNSIRDIMQLGRKTRSPYSQLAVLAIVKRLACTHAAISHPMVEEGLIPLLVGFLASGDSEVTVAALKCICRLEILDEKYRSLIIQLQDGNIANLAAHHGGEIQTYALLATIIGQKDGTLADRGITVVFDRFCRMMRRCCRIDGGVVRQICIIIDEHWGNSSLVRNAVIKNAVIDVLLGKMDFNGEDIVAMVLETVVQICEESSYLGVLVLTQNNLDVVQKLLGSEKLEIRLKSCQFLNYLMYYTGNPCKILMDSASLSHRLVHLVRNDHHSIKKQICLLFSHLLESTFRSKQLCHHFYRFCQEFSLTSEVIRLLSTLDREIEGVAFLLLEIMQFGQDHEPGRNQFLREFQENDGEERMRKIECADYSEGEIEEISANLRLVLQSERVL